MSFFALKFKKQKEIFSQKIFIFNQLLTDSTEII